MQGPEKGVTGSCPAPPLPGDAHSAAGTRALGAVCHTWARASPRRKEALGSGGEGFGAAEGRAGRGEPEPTTRSNMTGRVR